VKKSYTIFITHYPSLAQFETKYPTTVANFHMAFMESATSSNGETFNQKREDEEQEKELHFLPQYLNPSTKKYANRYENVMFFSVSLNGVVLTRLYGDVCVYVYMRICRVTFLHTVRRGTQTKSYGLNVAMLANIPLSVVKRAWQYSQRLQEQAHSRQQCAHFRLLFETLCNITNPSSEESESEEDLRIRLLQLKERLK
jgi:DNA mismatch repair ATPase MutS